MTISQFNIQLKTWRREDRQTYNEIMMLADSYGILLKNGEISKSKKNESKVQQFFSRYQREIGSYSNFIKSAKERRNKAVHEYAENLISQGTEVIQAYSQAKKELGTSAKEYAVKMRGINELIRDLFERAVSSNESRSMLDYSKSLSIDEQRKYLERKINEL